MTDPQSISVSATGDNAKLIGYIHEIKNFNQIIQITSWQQLETLQLKIASPYKGLKSFEAVDQRLFFGRDQFLKERFKELEQTNLILLLGASGSGKSSVVRAGMIPRLAESMGSQFIDLTFIPKHDPFASLYDRLHDRYPKLDSQLVLEGKTETLVHAVNQLKPADDFWFIFIDQFEELFTLSQPEKRDRFIESLVQLVKMLDKTQNRSVKIVATMRADFLDRLSPYPTLVKRTDQHRPFIAEMQLDELRLAIEQPALHHGVVFEGGLVDEIIKDVQGQSGYLPLLQYTLDLLWKIEVESGSIHDRTLNIINYRSLGGVRGTLQKHVEEVYRKLSQPEKQAVQRIFLKLVGIGGDEEAETEWKPIRRRANRSEFDEQLEQKMVARLINENLLVSNHETQSQEPTIEIAHEVLLTSWTTLSTWIQENRQAIALRNRLNDDVARWQPTKKEDELWSGSKLEQVVELRRNSTFNQVLGGFSAAANQFIDASVGKRDRQYQKELKDAQAKTRLAITTSVFAVVAVIAGGFVWQQRQQLDFNAALLDKGLDIQTPDTAMYIRDKLPDLFNKAEALRRDGKLEEAVLYYRRINVRAIKLLSKIAEKSEGYEDLRRSELEIQDFSKKAEILLAELISELRLRKDLKQDLENHRIGLRVKNGNSKDESHFTEGALRTTYRILMRDVGIEADLNGNGFIDSREEAVQIPCQTLDEIETLWRESTKNRCGWYGANFSYSDVDTKCTELNNTTLIYQLFSMPSEVDILDRFKECKVGQKPAGKAVKKDE